MSKLDIDKHEVARILGEWRDLWLAVTACRDQVADIVFFCQDDDNVSTYAFTMPVVISPTDEPSSLEPFG